MAYTVRYLLTFATALILALVLTPLGGWIGTRLRIVARPGGRRHHHGTISRLGGIGLVLGFLGALAVSKLVPIPTQDPNETRRFWGLVIGGVTMFVFGLIDDRFELPAWAEYVGYAFAALIAVASLLILERFNNPFTDRLVVLPALIYVPLTILWITGMIVTVNWLDGLDGLATGVSAILALILALHMARSGQFSVVPQAVALLGASLGFLVYNVAPARVHLGSNGAFFLGYVMGCLGLLARGRVATGLLVMCITIVDVSWTILDRWRHGESPFHGDRRHLHFRLKDAGLSTRRIVLIYWAFCALAGAAALMLSSRLYKLLSLGLLAGLTVALLAYLSRDTGSSP